MASPTPLEALEQVASVLLAERCPTLKDRLVVKVRYFGQGSRYEVRRQASTSKVFVTLYIHASQPTDFQSVLARAIDAATSIAEERVSVPVELLIPLRSTHPEIDALLTAKGI